MLTVPHRRQHQAVLFCKATLACTDCTESAAHCTVCCPNNIRYLHQQTQDALGSGMHFGWRPLERPRLHSTEGNGPCVSEKNEHSWFLGRTLETCVRFGRLTAELQLSFPAHSLPIPSTTAPLSCPLPLSVAPTWCGVLELCLRGSCSLLPRQALSCVHQVPFVSGCRHPSCPVRTMTLPSSQHAFLIHSPTPVYSQRSNF